MLHARPFAVEHDGGAGSQDPRGLLAAAVGKPPRIDPSKPGTPHASAAIHAGWKVWCFVLGLHCLKISDLWQW